MTRLYFRKTKLKGAGFRLTKTFWLIVLGLFFILIWILIFFRQNKQTSILEPLENIQKDESVIQIKEIPLIKVDFSLKQEEKAKLPIALVLDNFIEAWPLAGINSASIIYEAPVEADITRFLMIFNQENLPDKIGPIRSARPYFADLAEEYSGLFVHAGGSPDFLQRVKNKEYQIYNLDEISGNGKYFWRDNQKDKPHNIYISKESIIQTIENKKLINELKPNFVPWTYNQMDLNDIQTNNLIVKIDYREPVIWQFDKEKKAYLRYQNGKEFVDEEGRQVQTPNLIIQKTDIKILDAIGRREIITLGQGQALIFQKGGLIQGTWQKLEKNKRTIYYSSQGKEIEFLPGPIWIEIVSNNHQVLY